MNRRIALTTLALSIAAITVFASASARELGGELRRDYAEAAFGREGEQAPPPPTPVFTEKSAGNGPLDRLWFRPIGPATPSGRVDDLAVLESDPTTFYVAMATAGVYKTTNAGTTFTSVFDNEGSGSVGAIAIAADRREPGVGRHRRGQQPPELVVGRRHLQVHGRRPLVEEHGPEEQQADREDHRRSGRLQRRLRRGARRSVGRRRRARRLQDHRRRNDLEPRAARRRRHRRDRPGDRSAQQQDALCRDLSASPRAVGHERRRRRQRHLEVHRRRPDMGEARNRVAGRPEGPHRPGRSIAAIRTCSTRASSTRPRAASIEPTTAARPGGS